MTIVVNGMKPKAASRLLFERCKSAGNAVDFVTAVETEDGEFLADAYFTDAEWRVTTGTCNDIEFVEIKKVSGETKFMFVLTSGEFDSITIA